MTQKQREHDDPEQQRTRRPYQAPAIVDRAEFETLALTCAETDASCYAKGGTFNS